MKSKPTVAIAIVAAANVRAAATIAIGTAGQIQKKLCQSGPGGLRHSGPERSGPERWGSSYYCYCYRRSNSDSFASRAPEFYDIRAPKVPAPNVGAAATIAIGTAGQTLIALPVGPWRFATFGARLAKLLEFDRR